MSISSRIIRTLLPALSVVGVGCHGQDVPHAVRDDGAPSGGEVVDRRPAIDVSAAKRPFETATFALG